MNEPLRRLALLFQGLFNDFDPATRRCCDSKVDSEHAPLFIVGAPRTGTTLLYQLLLRRYELAFISNIMSALPRFMVRLCQRWPDLARSYSGPLERGYFGFLPGLRAPSEAGKVIDKWFQGPPERDLIRCTFAKIAEATERPVLLKSLTNSLRVRQLSLLFPHAGFIVVRRDPRFAAQSIIRARRTVKGSAQAWWSLPVPGREQIMDRDPWFQAVWQVVETERLVAEGLSHHSGPWTRIDYERLCEAPAATLESVAWTFGLRANAHAQNLAQAVASSNIVRCSPEEWDRIEAALRELAPERLRTTTPWAPEGDALADWRR